MADRITNASAATRIAATSTGATKLFHADPPQET